MMEYIVHRDGSPRMDSPDLRVFETVARTGSITRAAHELHTVQSNVTARVRLLEQELGVPLFHRHSRGVTLTPVGQQLLPYATRIGLLLAEARQVIGDGAPRGTLAVGSLETTAARRLPPILAAYTAAYPQVDVTLQTGTTAELIAAVLDHHLEGALVAGPVQHPELVEEPIVEEELVVVTAPACRDLDALLAETSEPKALVLRTGCSYRQRFERVLEARGVVGIRWLEFGMIDGIVGCAAAGVGITLLPRAVVEPALREGRIAVHALPAAEAHVETVFIRRRDAYLSSALARFLDCCRTAGADIAT
jgi:LysR family transcriptional regulator, cell division regulator